MGALKSAAGQSLHHSSSLPNKTIRLYGLPLPISGEPNARAGIDEGNAKNVIGVVYCGFKLDGCEVRVPTARIFNLDMSQVTNTGEVVDYVINGENIYYYDVNFGVTVQELVTIQAFPATEAIMATGGTFGSLVATAPVHTSEDLSTLDGMTREELLERVRIMMSANSSGSNLPSPRRCEAYVQTYRTTWYGVLHREDAAGADCSHSMPPWR
jgi:hypothetical protein